MATQSPIQVEIVTPSTAQFDLELDNLQPNGVTKRRGSILEENKDGEPASAAVPVLEQDESAVEYLDGGFGWAIVASESFLPFSFFRSSFLVPRPAPRRHIPHRLSFPRIPICMGRDTSAPPLTRAGNIPTPQRYWRSAGVL